MRRLPAAVEPEIEFQLRARLPRVRARGRAQGEPRDHLLRGSKPGYQFSRLTVETLVVGQVDGPGNSGRLKRDIPARSAPFWDPHSDAAEHDG